MDKVVFYAVFSFALFMASGLSFHISFYANYGTFVATEYISVAAIRLALLFGGIALFACAVAVMVKALESYLDHTAP